MGQMNNSGKGNQSNQHDGQKNYQNSNQRNPDNVRNATQKHQYKEFEETLKNDENYDPDTQKYIGDKMPEFDDKLKNVDKDKP